MKEESGSTDLKDVAPEMVCDRFSDNEWVETPVMVPGEMELTIFINRQELVTIQCTPKKLDFLVLGFLFTEGIISCADDVESLEVCEEASVADVRLINPDYELPAMQTLTSGCGGGAAFKSESPKVVSSLTVDPAQVLLLMRQLLKKMDLYRLSGGVHGSALSDPGGLILVAEDIGRHNTFDKIQGECLMRGISLKDRLLLSTGRVSSEMLLKAAEMQIPVLVSRTSPTERAVSLARELDVTLAGYARGNRLTAYSHPQRLGLNKGS